MTIKSSLFIGGAIALLTVSAFTVGRELGRKSKADWNAERWLRLLSGPNGVASGQTGQAGQIVAAPEVNRRAGAQVAAEITGRTDYPLYP